MALCLCVISAHAHDTSQWRYWTKQEGMAAVQNYFISKGPDNKLWITHGDSQVLSCFDGFEFTRIERPFKRAQTKVSDSGIIWTVGTNEIYTHQQGQWETHVVPKEIKTTTPFHPISDNQLLLVLWDEIVIYDRETHSCTVVKHRDDTKLWRFNDVVVDHDNLIWIIAKNGLAQISVNAKGLAQWTEYLHPRDVYEDYRYPMVNSQNELNLAASYKKGGKFAILSFAKGQWSEVYVSTQNNFIRGWTEDDGRVWLQLTNHQLRSFTPNGNSTLYRTQILSSRIRDIFLDKDGSFWIASSRGLIRYSSHIWKTPARLTDIQSSVHGILEGEDGRLWFDCHTHLLCMENGRVEKFPYPGFQSHESESKNINFWPDGRIAIRQYGAYPNLHVFNTQTKEFEEIVHPDNLDIRYIAPTANGSMLMQVGLDFHDISKAKQLIQRYDGQNYQTILDLSHTGDLGYLNVIYEDRDGRIWLGWTKGFGYIENQTFHPVREKVLAVDGAAYAMTEDEDGNLLVGGRNNLFRYDGTNWQRLLHGTGPIRSILIDQNNQLWLATNNGIYRQLADNFIPNTDKEGLAENLVFDIFQTSAGQIWAGTLNGISLYQPTRDRNPPKTYIETNNNQTEYMYRNPVRIVFHAYDQWNSARSERLLTSYKLNDEPWSAFSEYEFLNVPFFNLVPGTYTVRLRSMDRNLNIEDSGHSFSFTVVPPWYWQTPFLMIMTVCMLMITYLGYVALRNYRKKQRVIEELQKALDEISTLQGIIPICSFCHKIRDDQGFWEKVDIYLYKHTHAELSHSICPACMKQHYPGYKVVENASNNPKHEPVSHK